MWEKIKKILGNSFIWNVLSAIFSIILLGLNFTVGNNLLGIMWTICAACAIYFAYCDTKNKV